MWVENSTFSTQLNSVILLDLVLYVIRENYVQTCNNLYSYKLTLKIGVSQKCDARKMYERVGTIKENDFEQFLPYFHNYQFKL